MKVSRKQFLNLAASAGAAAIAGAPLRVAAQARGPRRTLIRGADVITMDRSARELPGVDVLIEGDRIAAVEKGIRAPDAEQVDGAAHIVLPGFVDGHRHVWEAIDAGAHIPTVEDDYNVWKMKIMPAMTEEDFYFADYVGSLEAIDSGVTSMINFAHGQHTPARAVASAQGAIDAGIGGFFCWQIAHVLSYGLNQTITFKQGWDDRNAPPTEAHYATSKLLRDRYFAGGKSPLEFGMALSNNSLGRKMTDVVEEFRRVRALGPGLITHHVRSTRANPPLPEGYYRNVADLRDARLLGTDYHTTHSNDWSDDELKILADTGSKLCSAVTSEQFYPRPSVHARALKLGVDIGVGLDAPLSHSKDYFELLRDAVSAMHRAPGDEAIAQTLVSSDFLALATSTGARALNRGDRFGTVEPGKRADLLLLRTDRFNFPPWGSLADRVVNFATQSDIDSVWIAGQARKRHGRMVGIDWHKLKTEQIERQARIRRDAATVTVTK